MDAVIVIPARYASSRYPAKPLALLRGASGTPRSLLERSVIAARAAAAATPGVTGVHVATDDDRIAAEAARIGADVILTDPECENGTARVAQAVARAGLTQPIVVNLQGDAPLTPPHFVTALVAHLRDNPSAQVATPVLRCDAESLANFRRDRAEGRVGATTVVRGATGQAVYFSKEVIPFTGPLAPGAPIPVFHHVGLYAYRPAALSLYTQLPQGELERLEGLEQLRFLEHGHPIAAVEVAAPGAAFWELNNPSDVPLIEAYLARMGID
jgi:3-deoxy-manno-octulosonate cytidylyltransferase (CMP-KDO synthetase)